MKKVFYKWILLENGEIVNYGIEDHCIEIFVDHVFPHENSSSDRDLFEMQEYADKYIPEHKYVFKYKETKIDFSDLEE